MKKKFELNLDAVVVLVVVFALALGLNFFQYRIYKELSLENYQLQIQGLEDRFNLDSMQVYIDQLKAASNATSSEGIGKL